MASLPVFFDLACTVSKDYELILTMIIYAAQMVYFRGIKNDIC